MDHLPIYSYSIDIYDNSETPNTDPFSATNLSLIPLHSDQSKIKDSDDHINY